MTAIRVAIPDMISPSYFPAIAAVELGFFKQEGLDASIELIYPVTKTYEELRDGMPRCMPSRTGPAAGCWVRWRRTCTGT
jgi:hypothetical protein